MWLPLDNGLRPEPIIAVGILLTWCSVERAVATSRLLPVAAACIIGALTLLIAQRMKESLQNSAQLTTVIEVDVTRVARLRARAKDSFAATEGAKLTFLPFFIKATVEALKQHPSLNAQIDGENIVYHASENISMAVVTPKGLITPVIKDAGDLNLGGIARKVGDLAARTGSGALRFVGRADDVIKVAGENVSLTEVEATLAQAPGVLEVAVVARPDEVRDHVPVAYVVARDQAHPPTADELAAWAGEQLTPQARPREWYLIESLPRTSVGKVRRFEIGSGDA